MVRRLGSVILVGLLVGTPAMADDLRAVAARQARAEGLREARTDRAHEARALGQHADREGRGRIAPKFLWTGVGLLAGGAAALALGFAVGDDCGLDRIGGAGDYENDCEGLGLGLKILGGGAMGAGATLLAIGAAKREHVTSLAPHRDGFIVRQSFSF
jgi:hypothetical protein